MIFDATRNYFAIEPRRGNNDAPPRPIRHIFRDELLVHRHSIIYPRNT